MESIEKILVYLGPSLPIKRAREILPNALYTAPAKQSDILSDVIRVEPTIIILIDGEIRQNLSPWHKELVYALQYPGVKAIYGAASMGALRAAELDFVGMIGIGQIYQWYKDGVTEDDAEVVLNYTSRESAEGTVYYPLSVPLVDIRAGVEHYKREQPEHAELFDQFFRVMQATYYANRTPKLCQEVWGEALDMSYPVIGQKAIDAVQVLTDFASYQPQPVIKLGPEHLSNAFGALYDRDRKISIKSQLIPQQNIDSYVLLHHPEFERICWDSANQELALLLCNTWQVMVSVEEIERESVRFQSRCGIETMEEFKQMLDSNGWSRGEYDRLQVQNARIRKLHHALSVSKTERRNTGAILDYLRTYQGFDYWAVPAALTEELIARKGVEDWDMGIPSWKMLENHFEREGLESHSNREEYLLETGFSNPNELAVALARLLAVKEEE